MDKLVPVYLSEDKIKLIIDILKSYECHFDLEDRGLLELLEQFKIELEKLKE